MQIRNIKEIAYFSVGLFILIYIIGLFFYRITLYLDPNEPKVEVIFKMRNAEYDILYLGNSIVQQAINPDVIDTKLDLSSYNLALGGASAFEMAVILSSYLNENKIPKLVVYGISINRADTSLVLRPTVKQALNDSIYSIIEGFQKENGVKFNIVETYIELLPIYKFRRAPERLAKYILQGSKRVPKWIKGHLALDISLTASRKDYPNHFSNLDTLGLRFLINLCKERNIPLMIIECPHSTLFNETTIGRDKSIAQLNTLYNGKFISFNSIIKLGLGDWVNINHLNSKGAIKFSKILSDSISSYIANYTE
jgi:hypothetical protein